MENRIADDFLKIRTKGPLNTEVPPMLSSQRSLYQVAMSDGYSGSWAQEQMLKQKQATAKRKARAGLSK